MTTVIDPIVPGERSLVRRFFDRNWTSALVLVVIAAVLAILGSALLPGGRTPGVAAAATVLMWLAVALAVVGVLLCLSRRRGGLPGWYVVLFLDVVYAMLAMLAASPSISEPGLAGGLVVLTLPTVYALVRARDRAEWARDESITLGVFDIVAAIALFAAFQTPRPGDTIVQVATPTDFVQLPALTVPVVGTNWVLASVMALLALASHLPALRTKRGKTPVWLSIVFGLLFVVVFLLWATAGLLPLPLTGLLLGALGLATPLVFGALGGVLGERAGVVNVAIEGQLLFGAFSAAIVGTITHSPWAGLFAAIVAGVLVAMVLAVFALRYWVDQVIVGVVLNVLVTGVTTFVYTKVLSDNKELNSTTKFQDLPIPGLSQIPVIGPVLFDHTIITYLMYVAVVVVWYTLFKTRWGLRVRAVGEHPQAADTVGIRVDSRRFWTVSIAGVVAGIGGAYYTLDSLSAFSKEMTAGAGFIALAAVIFGGWDPVRATFAALLFGFAKSTAYQLATLGSAVPPQFLQMLPYLVTIFAVAGLVGRSRPPAADGKPYIK